MDIKRIISEMTLEEKASLCSGRDTWNTKAIKRMGLPSITLSDGPHGLRKQPEGADNLGVNESIPATCFPTASALAASWDPQLLYQVGACIAAECLQQKVSVLLGPGINIKRSPLCGRNFEYYSEDPYLSGVLGAAFVNGVQSRGVGTSLKHFAANNQEHLRMTIDTIVDERALREIYYPAFEYTVQQASPWTVMCAYNRLNGRFCSEHQELLNDILRKEWGYEGLVVTDWGACNDRVEGLKAGQDLEMPGGGLDNDRLIVEAVKSGRLEMAVLDAAVERILRLVQKSVENLKENYTVDAEEHHAFAGKVAAQCAVLLKNEAGLLPLTEQTRFALIGELAARPRYQGSGSSLVNPTRVESALDCCRQRGLNFAYCPGYSAHTDQIDARLVEEACRAAAGADVAVVFAGLTDIYESEGFDREHMKLPANQNRLIERLAAVNPNLVVVLSGGAPVEMPWVDRAKAILNMYLSGQAGGRAVVDLLFGLENPSGKLAETYPLKLEDVLATPYFPEGPRTVEYRESIFVGYRYFDTAGRKVLFPFGHGLSYTEFTYSDLSVPEGVIDNVDHLKVTVAVKNSGPVPGAEVVQLYIQPPQSKIFKAAKELKGFKKVFLQPGEEKQIEFVLNKRSFAYYNVKIKDWHVENGVYTILIGASSRDIRLQGRLTIELPDNTAPVPDYRQTAPVYYQLDRGDAEIPAGQFEALYGKPLPPKNIEDKGFNRNSTVGDISRTFTGKIVYKLVLAFLLKSVKGDQADSRAMVTRNMIIKTAPQVPLRAVATSSGGLISFALLDGFIMFLNGKRLQGLVRMIKAARQAKNRKK